MSEVGSQYVQWFADSFCIFGRRRKALRVVSGGVGMLLLPGFAGRAVNFSSMSGFFLDICVKQKGFLDLFVSNQGYLVRGG